jgi:hypothetical protein
LEFRERHRVHMPPSLQALVAELRDIGVGFRKHTDVVDRPLVLRIRESDQRHAVVRDVAADGHDLVADHDLDPNLFDPLEVRSGIPAVEFAKIRREARRSDRSDRHEGDGIVLSDRVHVTELHGLVRASGQVNEIQAAQVVQQGFGRRVALSARIVIGIADQVGL